MGSVLNDNVAARVTAYETKFGDRTIAIYGNHSFTGSAPVLTFVGYSAGDAVYTLQWTSISDSILIEFAGHIAVGIDPLNAGIGYGGGKGAANVNGGPYHISLDLLDGSSQGVGSQDNQLQGADVLVRPTITTDIHNASHTVVTSVAVGTVVHDSATVTGTSGLPAPTGTVIFKWFANGACTGSPAASSSALSLHALSTTSGSVDAVGFVQTPVPSGSFAFQASYSGSGNYTAADGPCEPLTVNTAKPTLTTAASGPVTVGEKIHDVATLSGGFAPLGGTISFTLFSDAQCTVQVFSDPNKAVSGAGVYTSADFTTAAPGTYHWIASYSGDVNNDPVSTLCADAAEASTVNPPQVTTGKTMGFWSNTNGNAALTEFFAKPDSALLGSAVPGIPGSRGDTIKTIAESNKIERGNACNFGFPPIFNATLTANCTLAMGLKIQTLNTLTGQTLALTYNIRNVGGLTTSFAGQFLSVLLGSATCPSSLATSVGLDPVTNTVEDALKKANTLIANSALNGSTTQSQAGAMNALLGCLNRETP